MAYKVSNSRAHVYRLQVIMADDGSSGGVALQTCDLHKFYGVGRNAVHVLQGLNVEVPHGKM